MHIFYVTEGQVAYTTERPTSSVCCDCVNVFLQAGVHYESYASIPGYREIYLRVPIDELRRRDGKGIYAGAQSGDVGRGVKHVFMVLSTVYLGQDQI